MIVSYRDRRTRRFAEGADVKAFSGFARHPQTNCETACGYPQLPEWNVKEYAIRGIDNSGTISSNGPQYSAPTTRTYKEAPL